MTGPALGIDIGTTHTVAALGGAGGRGQPLLFDASFLLPSAVYADMDGRLLVGRDAERSARLDPMRFEPNPKRRVDEGTVLLGPRAYPVADLLAALLRRVGDEAARVAGALPARTVLTFPANWAGSRRGILVEAAERAGLPAVALVPEPVAAAFYFTAVAGHAVPPGGCLVVYDFGGGTFDTSVLRRRPDHGWEVLASDGIYDLGGVDLDAAIVEHLGRTLGTRDAALWHRLREPADDATRRRLLLLQEEARAAKEQLSRSSSAAIPVPLFDLDVVLTREEFEQLARPYLQRTVDLTAATLQRAGVRADQVRGLFLVGGSSRVPLASTLLHQRLGLAPTVIEQPELVVALGSLLAAAPAPEAGIPGMAAQVSGLPYAVSPAPQGPVLYGAHPGAAVPPAAAAAPGAFAPQGAGSPSALGVGSPAGPGVGSPAGPGVGSPTGVGGGAQAAPAAGMASGTGVGTPANPYPEPPPLAAGPPRWPEPGVPLVPALPERRGAGWRAAVFAGAAVVVLLACSLGGFKVFQSLASSASSGNNANGSRTSGSTNQGSQGGVNPGSGVSITAGGRKQTAEVNKSAWYALLKLTFRTVAYDASQTSYQLTADVLVENIGTDPADADVPIAFQDGDVQGTSIVDKATSVQAGTKADVTYRFNLPNLTGSLASGVFTIGRGDEARAVVPVGDKVPLVDYKPRAVLAKPVSFTFRDLSLKYDTCEVRGGWPYQFGQAKQGYLMLYCVFDLTYVGTYLGGHYVGVANFRLGLPDGTEVGPANAPNYDATSGQLIPNQPLAYQIKAPAQGTYLLRLVDVHPGEKRAPQYVHETPILL